MPDDEAMEEIIEAQIRHRWKCSSYKQRRKAIKQLLREKYGVDKVSFLPTAEDLWEKL